jgi:hypothetical protein
MTGFCSITDITFFVTAKNRIFQHDLQKRKASSFHIIMHKLAKVFFTALFVPDTKYEF